MDCIDPRVKVNDILESAVHPAHLFYVSTLLSIRPGATRASTIRYQRVSLLLVNGDLCRCGLNFLRLADQIRRYKLH